MTADPPTPADDCRLDWGVLDSLAHDMDDDTIADELVTIYLGELPARRQALGAALDADDADAMRAAAHALRAASATVGAVGLAELCRAIESAAAQQDTAAAAEQIQRALDACTTIDALLRQGR